MESGYQIQSVLNDSQYAEVSCNDWSSYQGYGQDLNQNYGNTTQEYAEQSTNHSSLTQDYVDPSQDYGKVSAGEYMEQNGQEYDQQGYYASYYSEGYPQEEYGYADYSCTQDGQYPAGWDMDNVLTEQHPGTYSANTVDALHIPPNSTDHINTSPGSFLNTSHSENGLDVLSQGTPSNDSTENVMVRDKTRNNFKKFRGSPVRKVYQRQAANVRERRRMRTINDAFENLRQNVPQASEDKKTSKVDTLKLAIQYIGDLTDVLQSCGDVSLPGLRAGRGNNKIIVSYSVPDVDPESGDILCGHSLSWVDLTKPKMTEDNKLYAPLWYPQIPTPEDLKAIEAD